ncbi:MAG: TonB family protein [Rhodothermales bacterium]
MRLQQGTMLLDRFAIGPLLGDPGLFELTYQATDRRDESGVVVREFYPGAIVRRGDDGALCVATDDALFAYGLAEHELEAGALARLSHPHVVRCLTHGSAHGTCYRVSERRMGISMRAYVRQRGGKIAEDEAIGLATRMLQGVEAGHELGLVHGMLSPTAVFMDRGRTPMLLNFSAARLYYAQVAGDIDAARVPGFSPPELSGERDTVGPWTDVFSAAALLLFMVTGKTPPAVMTPSQGKRLARTVERSREITTDLKSVLLQALQWDPTARPRSVSLLLDALARAVADRRQVVALDAVQAEGGADLPLEPEAPAALSAWDDAAAPAILASMIVTGPTMGLSEQMEEYGSEHQKRSAAVSKRPVEPVPAGNLPPTQELQVRIAELENRQKGFNRLLGTLVVVVLLAVVGFFAGFRMGLSTGSDYGRVVSDTAPGSGNPPAAGSNVVSPPEDNEGAAPRPKETLAPQPAPVATPAARPVAPAARANPPAPRPASGPTPEETQAAIEAEQTRQYQAARADADNLFARRAWREAEIAYASVLALRPDDRYATAQRTAARDSAAAEATRAQTLIENERQYQYLRGQADVLFRERHWADALDIYTAALAYRPGEAYLTEQIALARDAMEAASRAEAEARRLEDRIQRATDENGIFVVPETPARLVDEATVRNQVEYPARARRAGVEGRVILRMMIDEAGQLHDPTVVQGIGFGCEEEVIQVLQNARFEPATFNREPVKSWYLFTLVFSLNP